MAAKVEARLEGRGSDDSLRYMLSPGAAITWVGLFAWHVRFALSMCRRPTPDGVRRLATGQ